MDEETRAALDTLTSGYKRRLKSDILRKKLGPDESDYRYARPEDRFYRYGKEKYDPEKVPPTPSHAHIKETAKPRPSYCYNPVETGLVSLKNEIATLSVDTASASIILKAPINAALITRIENAVPFTQREWLESLRAWRFSPAALPMLKPILKDTYKDVQMLGVPKALPSTKFDQLMAKLSKDDKALIYKLLATKYHPDKGGTHEVMTLINVVFRG